MTLKHTPATEAKRLGTTVAAMSRATGQSRQTLRNWFNAKPELFRIVALGTSAFVKP